MTDHEGEKLRAEQARALDVYRRSGAMIMHQHLDRRQEVIGVTRDDLEDILSFDGMSAIMAAVGLFFLSGGGWLLVEKWLGKEGFALTPLAAFCFASVIFGLGFLTAGLYFHSKKRGRIKRIFDQTTTTDAVYRR